jgi:bifunctional UDP-N-acetylglucosamine pyrophosphorylase / glucosamine-1-phosphate N-acetyltransferase
MKMHKICAVIPAAGKGSRLGLNVPKILAPISEDKVIIDILLNKLLPIVSHINIVVSPSGFDIIKNYLINKKYPLINISLSIQEEPIGMGDAVFTSYNVWSSYEKILIMWGDQIFVSDNTLINLIYSSNTFDFILPIVKVFNPYVQYIFSNSGIETIKQTREGDFVDKIGFSDVGTFLISTKNLRTYWERYLISSSLGTGTKEINFLPFLIYLSSIPDFHFKTEVLSNPIEARGVNTQEDLIYFQNLICQN